MNWIEWHRVKRAALAAVLCTVLTGCKSSKVDGTDLHDVFDQKTASARATVSAPVPSVAKSALGHMVPRHRKPVQGPCIAEMGAPPEKLGRTARRPACRGAKVLEWRDPRGSPRYGCVYRPRSQPENIRLPLVVFFHDELDNGNAVYKKTRLQRRVRKFDMTGDAARRGFIVLIPQAQRIAGRMRYHTSYTSVQNLDVVSTDHFVDRLITEGAVDPRQIYAVGDAHGGLMATLYAMLRPDRVAAFAAYAADGSSLTWSCPGPPPPAAIVYRSCDTEQPCAAVESWLGAREAAGATSFSLRLGATNKARATCAIGKRQCKKKVGYASHRRWPKYRETEILEFLSQYSLDVGAENSREGASSG